MSDKVTLVEKLCSICKQIKPLKEFYIRKSTGRGHSACKICHQASSLRSILKRFGTFRSYNLMLNYGITSEIYDRMLESQQGRCLICEREKILVVDHNHKTGEVRGLLCAGCNTAIGLLQESSKLFDRAKEYVS